jgi:hypothetical protein
VTPQPHTVRGRAGEGGDGEDVNAAEAFRAAIAGKTDALAGDDNAIAEFSSIACLYPRGRYDLTFFPAFLDLDGQNHQFKIRCADSRRLTLPAVQASMPRAAQMPRQTRSSARVCAPLPRGLW